jgi:uncharacterized protein (TIGR02001 family)
MMTRACRLVAPLAASVGIAILSLLAPSSAHAEDEGFPYQAEPPPVADETRTLSLTANLAGTSQYMFRGYSQSAGEPTAQGGLDLTYGMLYLGTWASGIRYGGLPAPILPAERAAAEVDWYGGIRPTWNSATFDLGAIYYSYPGGTTLDVPFNYFELKAGVSGEVVDKLLAGVTVFWSPDFSTGTGSVWTVEGAAAYEFHKVWVFTPTISGVLGWEAGEQQDWKVLFANGSDSYLYWNAGLVLGVDNISFDFRYWDTNLSNAGNFCTGAFFQCDARFVFTTKVAVP